MDQQSTLHYKRSSRNINLATTAVTIHGQKPIDMSFELRAVKACFEIILPRCTPEGRKVKNKVLVCESQLDCASF